MELRHVRTFLLLSEVQHFGRVAAKMRVAQSAVSQTLKALEDELGAALFVRGRAGVRLTPAGEAFLPHARSALDSLARAAASAASVADGAAGSLCLHLTTMAALTVLPRAVRAFQAERPSVKVELVLSGSAAQIDALREGRCDLGFVSARTDTAGFASEALSREPLVMLVARDNPLATRRTVGFDAAAREPLVLLRRTSEPEVYAALLRRLGALGATPKVAMEVDQVDALLAFVAAGIGVSIVPGFVRHLRFRGVTAVPMRPQILAGITAVWNDASLSAAGRRFLELLRVHRDRAARGHGSA